MVCRPVRAGAGRAQAAVRAGRHQQEEPPARMDLEDRLTWNDHVLYQRAAMEFMGLRPPPAEFAFGFLDAPPPRRRRCRAPHPLDPGPTGHAEAHAPADE